MRRLKNWPSRFAALEGSVRARPFAWGTWDCCMWAAAAVEALTGVDLAQRWRGTYSSEAGATKLALRMGGMETIGQLAGRELQTSAFATTGDVGLVLWPDGTTSLGVRGSHAWLCVGDRGLVHLPLMAALQTWGVGRE